MGPLGAWRASAPVSGERDAMPMTGTARMRYAIEHAAHWLWPWREIPPYLPPRVLRDLGVFSIDRLALLLRALLLMSHGH